MLENFGRIELVKPVDLIISQIRNLISSQTENSEKKLPLKRILAKHFGLSQNELRKIIYQLQFYGTIKIQSLSCATLTDVGIVNTGLGVKAIE